MTPSEMEATPSYYLIGDEDGLWQACDLIEMLADLDGFETWAIGDALAYLVRAGRKTEDPTGDLVKARRSLTKALRHREERTA